MNEDVRAVLRLVLTPGLGPVGVGRLLERFGSAERVLGASARELSTVPRIGTKTADRLMAAFGGTEALADGEMEQADRLGVTLLAITDARYPALLRTIPDPPPVLQVLGRLDAAEADRFAVGLVGSRACTAYGIEQSERFAGDLARSGLTVVSGGARGIDTAAHRGALRAGGRTVAVLGCGLVHRYPPDNAELFDQIVGEDRGALLSELPLNTPPRSENFPARNRLISGLSLGVLVIEAGRGSGALITARVAGEDHGREVMALPGRVDSRASQGSLDLLRAGGAALVAEPSDVIELLEGPARHADAGTHGARYVPAALSAERTEPTDATGVPGAGEGLLSACSPDERVVLEALSEPMHPDALMERCGLEAGRLRVVLTGLEISGRVRRSGLLVGRSS